MKTRLLTALIGVPLAIFAMAVRGWFAELMIVALTMLALWEYYHALDAAHFRTFGYGAFAAAVAMWPLKIFLGAMDPLLLVAAAMGITITGVILRKEPSFPDAAVSVYPIFVCFLPFAMLLMMLNRKFGLVNGYALVTMAIAIAFICDGAAYFGGRALGKRKLCPTISPKKTVEGAAAGMIGGTLGALACRAVFVHLFGQAMPGIPAALLIGVIASAASQIGDLIASLLKRYAGIKDYGSILPGHGGIMDRFDSVIMAVLVLYCYTLVL